jgi:hypothetical protein
MLQLNRAMIVSLISAFLTYPLTFIPLEKNMQNSRMLVVASTLVVVGFSMSGTIIQAASPNPFVTPSGWAGLLQERAVQQELKLSDDQVAEFKKLIGKLSGNPGEVESEIRKQVMGEQLARIEQLNWQREGGYALFDVKVAKALSLTEEQQERLTVAAGLNAIEHKKMRDFMARARFRSREAMEQYVDRYRKPANERLLGVLTKDQRSKLTTMLGKPLSSDSKG